MLQTVEGVFRNGKVELTETPVGVDDARVLVTFLPEAPATPARQGQTFFGAFPGDGVTNDEDFKLAEWRGNTKEADGDSIRA